MSSTSKAWIVAASIGAVEAFKDQGVCRWNSTLRSLHQHAKSQFRSLSQPNYRSSQVLLTRQGTVNQSEESLKKVMYLSCWGPN